MRILWGSPLPPIRSGVSDYAVELLAELGRRARVRVLRPPQWDPPGDWPLADLVELVAGDSTPETGELCLVHLGNNPHHLWLLPRLRAPGSVVVLHDLVLHHLAVEAAVSSGAPSDLELGLRRAHGERGAAVARARAVGIAGRRDAFLLPARGALLAPAPGAFIVHSRWARGVLEAEFPETPVAALSLPAADPGDVDRAAVRVALGVSDHELVVMHLGFLTPEKGMMRIIAGVAAAVAGGLPARLLLVGEGRGLDELRRAAAAAGIAERVTAVGWLERERFLAAPAAADLGVVLRTPSAGESSAAGVRFLACGTPVAVGGLHQFLEWPEAAAPRLTPGPSAAADLTRLLHGLAADRCSWERRRRQARATYESRHRSGLCADALLEFLSRPTVSGAADHGAH